MNIRILSIALLFGLSAQTGFCFESKTLDFVKKNKRLPKPSEIAPSQAVLSIMAKNLTGADFSNTDLSKINFTGADLTRANFSNANLSEADFSGLVTIRSADFTGANLSGAKHGGNPVTKEWLKSMDAWNVDSVKGIN